MVFAVLFQLNQNSIAQEVEQREFDKDKVKIKLQDKLNLSDHQINQIEELKLNYKKEMIDVKANVERKKIEMSELKRKGNYTRDEYLEQFNGILSAKNEVAHLRANHQMDIYGILDENQKQEWNKLTLHSDDGEKHKFKKSRKHFDAE